MKLNVRIDGQPFDVTIEDIHAVPVIAVVDGERIEVWPEAPLSDVPQQAALLPEAHSSNGDRGVYAPIPGVIISVAVSSGETVAYGQELCVLEAMKMKQAIRSPRDGVIAEVAVVAGQSVAHHAPLVTYVE